ncbi:hypothetical protein NPIL_446211, partial [Nephila pilipes]
HEMLCNSSRNNTSDSGIQESLILMRVPTTGLTLY